MKKSLKEAFRIKGASWHAEQNKNTNNNSQIEGQRKSPKMNQTGKEPYENPFEKSRALQNAEESKATKMKFW